MTKTVRITDQDYDRIAMVREMTGLSTAQAARYVFHHGTDQPEDKTLRDQLEFDIERAIEMHPEYGDRHPEALRSLVEFEDAESLYATVPDPHFKMSFTEPNGQ